jgi:glycosyltransferase involved in cell wall biosynthesis
MRILQILHEFPPDAWAGTEIVTLQLSRALRERGHEVTIMTRVGDPTAEEFSYREEQRYGFDVIAVVNNYTKTSNLSLVHDNDFFEAGFIQLLTRLRPDVVHFQHVAHLSANLLATAAGLGYPTVLSLHDFYFACHLVHLIDSRYQLCAGPERGERCVTCLRESDPTGAVRHRFRFMEQALQEPDVVLAPSRFLAHRMLEYFPELDGRLRVIPLGVDHVESARTARSSSAPLRLLCVGALIPHKGAHVLLEALQGLPPNTFSVSFYGTASSYWQSYVDRLHKLAEGLSARFCGVYAHGERGAILAEHDVLVMPGICEETFSLMTHEALLAGLPVVAARRGALPEAIQDGGNGLLFEPENIADLRRCLARLLNEPGLVARLRAPQPRVKPVEAYAQDMEAVYTEVYADPNRLRMLRQRLVSHYQEMNSLRPEHERFRAERDALQARVTALQEQQSRIETAKAAIEQERDQALRRASALSDLLQARESQAQEREARLHAIYASTTWKLYRCYAALKHHVQRLAQHVWRRAHPR